MNLPRFPRCVQPPGSLGLAVLFVGLLAPQARGADSPPVRPQGFLRPTNDEFAAVSHSVIALLQSRDTARFAREIVASPEDWKAIACTNLPDIGEHLKSYADSTEQRRWNARTAARDFLAMADGLHLDFSKGDLHPRVVNPSFLGRVSYPALQSQGEALPVHRPSKSFWSLGSARTVHRAGSSSSPSANCTGFPMAGAFLEPSNGNRFRQRLLMRKRYANW